MIASENIQSFVTELREQKTIEDAFAVCEKYGFDALEKVYELHTAEDFAGWIKSFIDDGGLTQRTTSCLLPMGLKASILSQTTPAVPLEIHVAIAMKSQKTSSRRLLTASVSKSKGANNENLSRNNRFTSKRERILEHRCHAMQ